MWPATYSARLRVSSRMALPSARMRRTSAVLTSAVFWFGSPIVDCRMVCAGAALPSIRAPRAAAKPAARTRVNGVMVFFLRGFCIEPQFAPGRLPRQAGALRCRSHLFVGQSDTRIAAELLAVVVGLEAGCMDAVGGELLVAILGIAGNPDRADHLAGLVADLQAAAFGKDLVAAGADQVAHENRLLLGADLHELGGAAHGERRIGFAIGHLEPDHGGAILLLKRLQNAARLDHEHRERPAIDLGAPLENGGDNTICLIQRDGAHGVLVRGHGPAVTFRCNEHAGLLMSIACQSLPLRCLAPSPQRSQISAMTDQSTTTDNPLLEDWRGPFGVPPFGRIAPEHFMPAFDRAFAEHDTEIAAIASDAAAPTFESTIEAMERTGRTLDRVGRVFGVR